jgi:hypothetical protein
MRSVNSETTYACSMVSIQTDNDTPIAHTPVAAHCRAAGSDSTPCAYDMPILIRVFSA